MFKLPAFVRLTLKSTAFALSFGIFGFPMLEAQAADQRFIGFLRNFYPYAAQEGISAETYRKTFQGVSEPDPTVLDKAANQPEFKSQIWDYLDSRVNPYTVKIGREMKAKYGPLLQRLEQRYGVDRHILLAIWSMESNYGAVLARDDKLHYVPTALATMAYSDPKRAAYARKQLIAALKIIQSGEISPREMTGSWAGAMGHTQFIPTSYLLYAADGDGDGRRDIWNSVPDALATSANLLSQNGWNTGKTWGYEVSVPQAARHYSGKTQTLAQWTKLGLQRANGKPFKALDDRATLKMPGGSAGPGFLMLSNFFTVKKYNAADSYALAVGLLADEIAGYGGMTQPWPRPAGTLDIKEKFELQTRMKALGFYAGEIDGNFGSGSKAAIATLESRLGMPATGEPSLMLLQHLRGLRPIKAQ